jgi:hypothetical protein
MKRGSEKIAVGIVAGVFCFLGLTMSTCGGPTEPTSTAPHIFTSLAAITTVATGSSTALSIAATGSSPLTYQWYFNGTAIASATASSYSKTWAFSDSGTYKVIVTNSAGKDSSETQLKITKNPKLSDFFIPPSGWVTPTGAQIRNILSDSMVNYVNGADLEFVGDSVMVAGKKVSTLDTGVHLDISLVNEQDSVAASVFILDYMNSGNATTVYNRFKSSIDTAKIVLIGSYDSTTVIGEKFDDKTLKAYGHFGKYFIIVSIYSLIDFPDAAVVYAASFPKMNPFLTLYQSLIE